MKWFSIPNLTSTSVNEVADPLKLEPYPWPANLTKDEIHDRIWMSPKCEHHFLSPVEGVAPNVRVSYDTGNLPTKLHGLIVDYDSSALSGTLSAICESAPGPYRPRWACKSIRGNYRIVWDFEDAVLLPPSKKATMLFLALLAKRLRLIKWWPGFDVAAYNPCQYFELGRDWETLPKYDRIPKDTLDLWMWEATKTAQISANKPDQDIPLDEVEREVHSRFPGRWTGRFEPGARGPRFWDPTASNPSAAVVREDGMQCFSGDRGFMSWRDIFGSKWVEQFEASRIKGILERTLHDGQAFWVLDSPEAGWTRMNSQHFTKWLKCAGFDSVKDKGATASDTDRIEVAAITQRHIAAAMPFLYYPHGPMEYRGERVLNTSRVQVMAPAPATSFENIEEATTQHFPFTWSFLSQFLDTIDGEPRQFQYLLSWIKHAYMCGFQQKPQPGHALVLAGPASKGKTFLASVLLSRILGGSSDASDFLVKGSQWTDQLAKWPIALVDDEKGSSDYDSHRVFSIMVKRLVASQTIAFNGKWMATGEVAWNGRVIICCNDDAESVKLIPSLDFSIADKISLLRVNATSAFRFPANRSETAKILDQELPFFCRFLIDFKYPDELINKQDTRYFLKPFKHPELYSMASTSGNVYATYELLVMFMKQYRQTPGGMENEAWEGTASELHQSMTQFLQSSVIGRQNPRSLGSQLGLLQARGVPIERLKQSRNGTYRWRIPVDLEWGPSTAADLPPAGDMSTAAKTATPADKEMTI